MKHIAILGLGVVGKGTADLLENNKKIIEKRVGDEINIKYILDLRDFPGTPYESRVVHDFSIIEKDKDITLVAETMGGAHPAYDFSLACLKAGKSVVTSNKEVVATFGEELTKVARENGVSYAFEASVGGGIPIIRPLVTDFIANEIVEISGIMNGTTNYILTQMKEYGKSYADALKEAQEKGYAEKDPTADVEGIDTCRKICILTALATGILPDANKVRTVGISGVSGDDVKLLDKYGYAVKLLGRMVLENGKPCLIVAPFVCDKASPLAHVDDVFNGITVKGNTLGQTMFYGRGAGADPTASAVANDILSILKDGDASFAPEFVRDGGNDVISSLDFACRRYVRTDDKNTLALLGDVKDLGGAYVTEKYFTESEFDKILEKLGNVSTLRVL
ncbi:MAG: homoserine dehydrogenase [Clostridia bacterium]|nr:homoserine dehydrogenase [Clostridia bacterium]